MVDTNYFSEQNRNIIIQTDRLLLNSQKCNYTLQISLTNQQCHKIHKVNRQQQKNVMNIVAIYGIMKMEVNSYLIVVTKSTIVGQIFKKKVFQVQQLEFICLSQKQADVDRLYVDGVKQVLGGRGLYFSHQYDLTLSLQKYIQSIRKADTTRDQYMFNGEWVKDLKKLNAVDWITPFISGFIAINFVSLSNDKSYELCLVTRRDKRRPALRYTNRGTDREGNPANSCQTQQILFIQDSAQQEYFSYVQYRGSIPFLWSQDPDLRGKPKIAINQDKNLNQHAIQKHYEYVISNYEKCVSVNLTDKTTYQSELGKYFNQLHDNMRSSNLEFIWFDFHEQCKKHKYQNIAKLLDILNDKQIQYGYFHLKHSKQQPNNHFAQSKRQTGVFRTNCMDCLDRTNVVQSVITRKQLFRWLQRRKIIQENLQLFGIPKLPISLQQIFRDQWTQNANALSRLYSGTDAMKSDFTSKGKRTMLGVLKDGRVGTKRFFLDNFFNSRKLDFLNFSLGKIKPSQNQNQKIRHSKMNSLYILGAIVISIPVLIHYSVDHNTEEEAPRTAIKIGLTAVSLLVFAKVAMMLDSVIVRKPIKIN